MCILIKGVAKKYIYKFKISKQTWDEFLPEANNDNGVIFGEDTTSEKEDKNDWMCFWFLLLCEKMKQEKWNTLHNGKQTTNKQNNKMKI